MGILYALGSPAPIFTSNPSDPTPGDGSHNPLGKIHDFSATFWG